MESKNKFKITVKYTGQNDNCYIDRFEIALLDDSTLKIDDFYIELKPISGDYNLEGEGDNHLSEREIRGKYQWLIERKIENYFHDQLVSVLSIKIAFKHKWIENLEGIESHSLKVTGLYYPQEIEEIAI